MEQKNKTAARRIGILCAGFGLALSLAACSGQTQPMYVATDGHMTVGIGQYKQGEWIDAACNWETGKVDITSTHITSGIPLKLNSKHLICDTVNHKLIATVKAQENKDDDEALFREAFKADHGIQK